MNTMPQVFLSYARKDEERVENLYHKLAAEGLSPWMDKKNILPGEIWRSCIQKALRASDFFVVCLSANSFTKRGFLQKEIHDALEIWEEKLEGDIYLIPARLEDCGVPDTLNRFQWVNLNEEDGLQKLIRAIQVGMQRRLPISEEAQLSISSESEPALQEAPKEPISESRPSLADKSSASSVAKYEKLIETAIGDYILDGLLGVGGQCVVFLAHNRRLQTRVALKIYGLRGDGDSPSKLDTALLDTALLDTALPVVKKQSQINHPSIVKSYPPGVAGIKFQGSEQLVIFIPVQYAPLGSCQEDPPFKDKELTTADIEALIGLVDGLRIIHENDILHQDIKPANILLFHERYAGEDAIVLRISNFGFAQVLSAITDHGEIWAGLTPEYMAPERAVDKGSTKSDVYSLGATIFYLVTGHDPIRGPEASLDLTGWQTAHLTQPRPNAMDHNPYCLPRLALLIIQMMSVEPNDRPTLGRCIQILRELTDSLDGRILGYRLPEALRIQFESGDYRIHYTPSFRGMFKPAVHLRSGEQLFILRTQTAHPVFSQHKRLVEFMVRRFSDCFRMYETYGTYDVQMFVWSDRQRAYSLKADLERDFPGSPTEVMYATNVHHFHTPDQTLPENVSVVRTLAVQEGILLPGLEREEYLCGEYPEYPPEHSIRAFTYVNSVAKRPGKGMLRVAIIESVRRKMQELVKRVDERTGKRWCPKITIIELASECDEAVLLVDFVASDYKYLHQVPLAIIELGAIAVRAGTFLETGRLVIQSDKILF